MNYWITAQWPPRENEAENRPPVGVYILDGKLDIANGMTKGDFVFVYETLHGPTLVRNNTDRSVECIKCRSGRGGIVALLRILENPYEREHTTGLETYTNKEKKWWRYCAPTECLGSAGFLPRSVVNQLLGYKERYDRYPSLLKIEQRKFVELQRAFSKITAEFDESVLEKMDLGVTQLESKSLLARRQIPSEMGFNCVTPMDYSSTRYGVGGEGSVHLHLKQRIAANPAAVLEEPGLALWKEE